MRHFGILTSSGLFLLWCWWAAGTSAAQTPAVRDTTAIASPSGAMWRSLAVPGWGQWYNGRRIKAALAAGTEITLVTLAIREHRAFTRTGLVVYEDRQHSFEWLVLLTVLLSMTDAYVDAYLDRFDEQMNIHATYLDHTAAVRLSFAF